MASGPLAAPLPKVVVISKGTPYNTTVDSSNVILKGVSAKLYPAFVFSGMINRGSRKFKVVFNDNHKLKRFKCFSSIKIGLSSMYPH